MRTIRRVRSQHGLMVDRFSLKPPLPLINAIKIKIPPTPSPMAVPAATPAMPHLGRPIKPTTSAQLNITLIRLTTPMTSDPVRVSPAPARQDMPTMRIAMSGPTATMIWK